MSRILLAGTFVVSSFYVSDDGPASYVSADGPASDLRATVSQSDEAISIRIGDKPVLVYNKTDTQPPEGIDRVYARSGYIHPIYSPAGGIVTGHYAKDHPHQMGLFNAWVNASFRGHRVDFWNKKKAEGRVSHHSVNFVRNDGARAEFSVELVHEDITDADSPVTVLTETWHVMAYPVIHPGFVIDIVSTQRCATSDPLLINEYHYGGMAFRGCDEWYREAASAAAKLHAKAIKKDPLDDPPGIDEMGHEFLTSESKRRFVGNHTRPKWVDISGITDGGAAGIAILGHGQNFRAPQPVRLHPNKPYFCFAPMVTGAFKIEPGKPYVSKYRLVIHDDVPNPNQLDEQWLRFNAEER